MYKYKRILLIDDDGDDQDFFRDAITELNTGLICVVAENGLDGLKKMDTPPPPDLVFVDINMPVMNGFQYLNALRLDPRYQNIPAIVLSTSSSPDDKETAQQLGAKRFITKPNNFELLKKTLMEMLTSDLA